ncbi:Crp/Fnr family transcriptional regulator [Aquimarina muelleri]|uniref:Crp/Fnr family transcriptional regulator n=1 Tax=Aquimarina muelleri TaxID=279356 RepID=A0A918JXV0_9FLAO|nr:Crp/Fnr family transcriptional regulator [Aquimarina muelleri]MCX2762759.1 Crp/Fnr family transcriptional regulator [Aquimarina muelleri]GGX18892.1 Crp/Fnr family transcriptional regulator [Aquimarina muelleri]
MIQEIKNSYGDFFEEELLEEINRIATFKEIPEGFEIIKPGSYIRFMPLIIHGAIKVLRTDNDGDELLLYFLEKGDTCAMTLSCCLGHHKSEIKAIAETDTKLVMIPISKMEEWTTKYKSWRNFVFDSYHKRLIEAIETIDSIAFLNMDDRLLKYLRDKIKINNTSVIHSTHQQIAYDLHTSRVVISRLLKKLEKDAIVKLNRNNIEILQT